MTLNRFFVARSSMRALLGVWITLGAVSFSPAARADMVYYSDTGQLSTNRSINHIVRVNTDGTGAQTILTGTNGNAFGGIAFDESAGYMYSGDHTSLFRTNLDGTNRVNLVPTTHGVNDVELDLAGGKIYWTVGGRIPTEVFRANLDGSGAELVLTRDSFNFAGIAIDHAAGKLYYAIADTIGVSNLDGTGQTVFATLPVGAAPYDVEIDTAKGKLYWNQDSSSNPTNRLLRSANLDGSGSITDILSGGAATRFSNGIALDSVNQKLYYTNGGNSSGPFGISRVNPDGTGNQLFLTDGNGIDYLEVLHTSAAVPEPSILLLSSLAALGLAGHAWSRHRRAD